MKYLKKGNENRATHAMIAGGVSGFFNSFIITPTDLVKTSIIKNF